MGDFSVTTEIDDPHGDNFQAVEALVDTGASYITLPASLLRHLGVAPQASHPFLLADGRTVERDLGRTWVRIDERMEMTIVVFADEGTRPLVGDATLEEMRLGVDPVGRSLRRLVPVPGYLMSFESVS